MRKLLKCSLFAISCCLPISCATLPPDVFVFENLPSRVYKDPKTGHTMVQGSPTCMAKLQEMSCGHGVKIISGQEIFVGENAGHTYAGKKWSELQAEAVIAPAKESYAPLKTYMIDACKKMNCNDQINAFRVKLDELKGVQGAINPEGAQ